MPALIDYLNYLAQYLRYSITLLVRELLSVALPIDLKSLARAYPFAIAPEYKW